MPENISKFIGKKRRIFTGSKQNRFANYYAVSGAWVVSKENFMQDISWLSSLKLRGSYGPGKSWRNFSTGCESVDDKR
jgi:hypothetical protein